MWTLKFFLLLTQNCKLKRFSVTSMGQMWTSKFCYLDQSMLDLMKKTLIYIWHLGEISTSFIDKNEEFVFYLVSFTKLCNNVTNSARVSHGVGGTPCLWLVGKLCMALWPYFLQWLKRRGGGAKFYIFDQNCGKWGSKIAKFSKKFPKGGRGVCVCVSKLNKTEDLIFFLQQVEKWGGWVGGAVEPT